MRVQYIHIHTHVTHGACNYVLYILISCETFNVAKNWWMEATRLAWNIMKSWHPKGQYLQPYPSDPSAKLGFVGEFRLQDLQLANVNHKHWRVAEFFLAPRNPQKGVIIPEECCSHGQKPPAGCPLSSPANSSSWNTWRPSCSACEAIRGINLAGRSSQQLFYHLDWFDVRFNPQFYHWIPILVTKSKFLWSQMTYSSIGSMIISECHIYGHIKSQFIFLVAAKFLCL